MTEQSHPEPITPDEYYVMVDENGRETGSYGWTPDGTGILWYDSEVDLLINTNAPAGCAVEITEHELAVRRGEA